jgi:glycosyltransferase involved in cell wall biosynthesis
LLGTFDKKLPVEPLLQCLADLRDKPTSVFNRIRLIQVGRVDHRWFNEELKRFGLEASCSLHGLQSRERSIEILNACSLFYLGVTPGWGDRITTARVYDLLASGRPILAYAGPGSELAGLLSGANRSRAFSDSDIPAATAFIEQLASDHAGGGARFEPISNYARQYSWNEVAARFATLFDRLG